MTGKARDYYTMAFALGGIFLVGVVFTESPAAVRVLCAVMGLFLLWFVNHDDY